MKKFFSFTLLYLLITISIFGQDKQLVSINRKIYSLSNQVLSSIKDRENIAFYRNIPGEEAKTKYGIFAQNGILLIETHNLKLTNETKKYLKEEFKIGNGNKKYVVNNKMYDSIPKDINRNDIQSIEGLSGLKAVERFKDNGINGVVIIHLK